MQRHYITLKTVKLNNNCPECFSNEGLKLTFKQEFIETRFYKSITNITTQDLHCTNCNSTIYPVQWTDDIDRIATYHKKTIDPKPKLIKLKKQAWVIIIAIDITILLLILYAFGVF